MPYPKTACALLPTLLLVSFSGNAQALSSDNQTDSLLIPQPKHETLVQPHIDKGALNNALDVLNGQTAGVNVTSNGLDRMAMLNSVRVRGTTSIMGGNDPLVIIDGVASDIATLSTIYPADIESFNILKNASETSIYGARGASGVIEVRTKKGTGNGFHISYEGNVGVESMYRQLDMLSAADYRNTASSLGLFCNDGGFDTDFYQAITRTGFVQNHYLAFSGGNETSNYRASLGFVDHNTIIRTKDFSNLVVKADLTQKAFDNRLTADFGVFGSSFKNHDIFDTQMLFYSAACQNPTFPEGRDANGNWTKDEAASFINPPVVLLSEKNDSKDLNFDAHLRLTYALTPDLNISAFASFAYSSTENAQFCPTYVWAQGNVYRGETKKEEGLGNLSADYAHTWGQHRLEVHASTEYQKLVTTAFWVQAKGIPNNLFGYDNIGATASRPYDATGSTYEERALSSVMGNANYTLRSRYAFNASLRADGSSMVGKDQAWGFFPSLSANWNVKEEAFLKSVRPVSMMKLRAGWGKSGNLGGISAYTTRNTASQTGVVPVNNAPTVTLGAVRNTNPYLKWETKTTWNVGVDLGLWNNRVMLSAEYYHSLTSDMLYEYDVPVPPFAFDKLLANIGSMSNSGWELGVLFTPLQRKDMELNVNLNLSFQKNKLRSLSGNYQGLAMSAAPVTAIGSLTGAGQNGGDNNVVYQIVGQPLGVFYLPHCRGLVLDEYGHYKYDIEDLNGDGAIDLSDGGDRYIAGQATPKVTLGSNISFRYRQFYVSLQMNGAFGHKIFNGTGLAFTNMSSFPDYNVLANAPAKNIVDQRVSDYWLESGNCLNFENLTLGYDVPLRSRTVRSLRFSCSVSNLGTISAYSGLTPMINSYVVNSTLGIDDKRTYPLYRTYSVGLSVQF